MLTAMELVHRADDGTYANADEVDRFLVEGKKSYARALDALQQAVMG